MFDRFPRPDRTAGFRHRDFFPDAGRDEPPRGFKPGKPQGSAAAECPDGKHDELGRPLYLLEPLCDLLAELARLPNNSDIVTFPVTNPAYVPPGLVWVVVIDRTGEDSDGSQGWENAGRLQQLSGDPLWSFWKTWPDVEITIDAYPRYRFTAECDRLCRLGSLPGLES